MASLRVAEQANLPQFDRTIDNVRLLASICQFLLRSSSSSMVAPPEDRNNVTLQLFLYIDGFKPRGRTDYRCLVALVDVDGLLPSPTDVGVPGCTMLLSWRQLAKSDFTKWAAADRQRELNYLANSQFSVVFPAARKIKVSIQPRFMAGDHHHLWWEAHTNGCEMCDWDRRNPLASLFAVLPQAIGDRDRESRLHAVCSMRSMHYVQPILHNLKGLGSRFLGVTGRVMPADL